MITFHESLARDLRLIAAAYPMLLPPLTDTRIPMREYVWRVQFYLDLSIDLLELAKVVGLSRGEPI